MFERKTINITTQNETEFSLSRNTYNIYNIYKFELNYIIATKADKGIYNVQIVIGYMYGHKSLINNYTKWCLSVNMFWVSNLIKESIVYISGRRVLAHVPIRQYGLPALGLRSNVWSTTHGSPQGLVRNQRRPGTLIH